MRLVQVRDLIAGQGWFDVTQYRLNPPDGVVMHWSRLVDLPIAILLRAGELVLPSTTAERLVLTVWPAALLLVLLFGIVRIARELADDAAARLALIFAALMAPVLQHFRPGAIDHHNVQLVLMIWSTRAAGPRTAARRRRLPARCARCRSRSARRWRPCWRVLPGSSPCAGSCAASRAAIRRRPSAWRSRPEHWCCSSRPCRQHATPSRPATRSRSSSS